MPGEVLGVSDGRPDQRLTSRVAPVLPRRPGESVRTFSDGVEHDWQEVTSFIDSWPDDRHFTWDGVSGEVRFGPRIRYPDGTTRQHGAVPKDGAEITLTEYRHGGGAAGNVGAQTLSVLRTTIPAIDRVINLAAAFGGVDAESVENAKRRGPLALRRGQQAITADDYERIALESAPSIGRARCLPPAAPGRPIRLLVVPYHEVALGNDLDAFALTDEIVATLLEAVERRRVLGIEVEIGTPYYQGVSVAALVAARPGRAASAIEDERGPGDPALPRPRGGRSRRPRMALRGDAAGPRRRAPAAGHRWCRARGGRRLLRVRPAHAHAGRRRCELAAPHRGLPVHARRSADRGPVTPTSAASPTVPGRLRHRRPEDWMLAQLPPWMLDDDLFRRFVSLFQSIATTYLEQADQLEYVFDPAVAPPAMVRQMGRWLGLDVPDDVTHQRELVLEMSKLSQWRGTSRQRVRRVLELISGDTVEVTDSGGTYRDGEAPGNDPYVQIRIASTGWTDEGHVLDLVRRELPAFVGFELWIGATRRWPVAAPPDGGGSATITCTACGLPSALPAIRMAADEFCSVCDFPLFWAKDLPADGTQDLEPIERPWLDQI